MPKYSAFSILILWLVPTSLQAQLIPELAGARAAALGMGVVTSSDIWAVQNNIGALEGLEFPTVAFAFNTKLNIKELTTFGALFGIPVREGNAAASFTRFGTGAYNFSSVGLGYSHKIRFITVGLKLSYLQQAIEGFLSQGTIVIEAGGKAELLPHLHFAAHAYNLTQSTFRGNKQQLVPVILKAGLEFQADEKTALFLQTYKEVDFPARFSSGLEYKVLKELHIRTGIQTAPVVTSFGIGFHHSGFIFDYGFRHHNTIGAAHHLSIGLSLKPKRKK